MKLVEILLWNSLIFKALLIFFSREFSNHICEGRVNEIIFTKFKIIINYVGMQCVSIYTYFADFHTRVFVFG